MRTTTSRRLLSRHHGPISPPCVAVGRECYSTNSHRTFANLCAKHVRLIQKYSPALLAVDFLKVRESRDYLEKLPWSNCLMLSSQEEDGFHGVSSSQPLSAEDLYTLSSATSSSPSAAFGLSRQQGNGDSHNNGGSWNAATETNKCERSHCQQQEEEEAQLQNVYAKIDRNLVEFVTEVRELTAASWAQLQQHELVISPPLADTLAGGFPPPSSLGSSSDRASTACRSCFLPTPTSTTCTATEVNSARLMSQLRRCLRHQYEPLQYVRLPEEQHHAARKTTEVNLVAMMARLLRLQCGALDVVDVGCGKGWLSTTLSKVHWLPSVGIEGETRLADKARQFSARGKRPQIRPTFTTQTLTPQRLGRDKDLLRKEFRQPVVIGLHTCGALGESCLRLAVESDAKGVISLPCCYHKLRNSVRYDCMSKFGHDCFGCRVVQEEPNEAGEHPEEEHCCVSSQLFSRVGLQLAGRAQGLWHLGSPGSFSSWHRQALYRCSLSLLFVDRPSAFVPTVRKKSSSTTTDSPPSSYAKERRQFSRQGELIVPLEMEQLGGQQGHTTQSTCFSEFVRRWGERSGVKVLVPAAALEDWFEANFLLASSFVSARVFQQQLAFSIEWLLLADRCAFLAEHGYTVLLGEILPRSSSSRNLGLVAFKMQRGHLLSAQ